MAVVRNPQTGKLEIVDASGRPVVKKPANLPMVQQPADSSSLLSKIGKGALGIAKEVALQVPRLGAAVITPLTEDLPALITGQKNVTTSPVGRFAFGGTEYGTKERAAAEAGQAVSAASLLPMISVAGKTAEAANLSRGAAARAFAKQAIKTAPVDSALGAGFGLTSGLQQGKSGAELAKETALGAGIGAIAPVALGLGFKGIGALARGTGRVIEGGAAARIASLESKQSKLASEIDNFYGPTPRQAVAQENLTKSIDRWASVRDIPFKFKRNLVNDQQAISELEKNLDTQTGQKSGIGETARAAPTIGRQEALTIIQDEYDPLLREAGDKWKFVNKYAELLNEEARLKQGKVVEANRTIAQNLADQAKVLTDIGPQNVQRLQIWNARFRKIIDNELTNMVDSGLVSPESAALFKQRNPNYTPNVVKDFFDNPEAFLQGSGSKLSVTQSGIKTAKGSARELLSADQAVMQKIAQNRVRAALNRAQKEIIQKVEAAGGNKFGVEALRTAENVTQRLSLIEERKILNDLKDGIEGLTRSYSKELRRLQTEVRQLERRGLRESYRSLAEKSREPAPVSPLASVTTKFTPASLVENAPKSFDQLQNSYAIKGLLQKEFGTFERLVFDVKEFGWDRLVDAGIPQATAESVAKQIFKEPSRFAAKTEVLGQTFATTNARTTREFVEQLINPQDKTLARIKGSIGMRDRKTQALIEDIEGLKRSFLDIQNERAWNLQAIKAVADTKTPRIDLIKEGGDTVSFFNNGVQEVWRVPKELAQAMKNIDPDEFNALGKWLDASLIGQALQKPASAVRQVAVKKNPFFVASNTVRDVQQAMVNSNLTLADWGKTFAKGLVSLIAPGSDTAFEFKALQKTARENAGLIGGFVASPERQAALIRDAIRNQKPISRVLKNPLKLVEEAGSFMEEITRTSVFERTLKDTGSIKEAARMARSAGADFTQSGTWVKTLNKVVPFLNARVQGLVSFAKSSQARPIETARALLMTAVYPTTILYQHNSQYASYQDIPEWEKRQYWIFMVGETQGKDFKGNPKPVPQYIKIPKGEPQQIVSALIERTLNQGKEKFPESTTTFLKSLAGSVSPVTETSLIPTALQYPLELKTNYSFFREKQIEPDYVFRNIPGRREPVSFKTADLPPAQRYDERTSEIAKALGSVLNFSPIKLDYVLKTGALRDVIQGTDIGLKGSPASAGTPFDQAAQLPFVRSVLGNSNYGNDLKERNMRQRGLQIMNQLKAAGKNVSEIRNALESVGIDIKTLR